MYVLLVFVAALLPRIALPPNETRAFEFAGATAVRDRTTRFEFVPVRDATAVFVPVRDTTLRVLPERDVVFAFVPARDTTLRDVVAVRATLFVVVCV